MSLQNICTHVLKCVNNIFKCANNILCCECYIHTGMAFTCYNAVRPVEDWWGYDGLGRLLYIWGDSCTSRRTNGQRYERRIRILTSRNDSSFWITTDPLASWRRLISRLDEMFQSPVADAIRDYAEPLAGAICNVMYICC